MKAFISLVVTGSTYSLLLFICKYLLVRLQLFRKLVFGKAWLEGTWVGFYIGRSGKVRYYTHTIEQDFDRTLIRANAFKENGSHFAFWVIEETWIKPRVGTLQYMYQTFAHRNNFLDEGLANFSLCRDKPWSFARRTIGYFSDHGQTQKLPAMEFKLCSHPENIDMRYLLAKAKNFYELNEILFQEKKGEKPKSGEADLKVAVVKMPKLKKRGKH
ncbi:MAG: hypothetical protein GY790_17030 [Bacteroidetes bacterium]|nr:hypothetical protein [Bacteroidota bacterium]